MPLGGRELEFPRWRLIAGFTEFDSEAAQRSRAQTSLEGPTRLDSEWPQTRSLPVSRHRENCRGLGAEQLAERPGQALRPQRPKLPLAAATRANLQVTCKTERRQA